MRYILLILLSCTALLPPAVGQRAVRREVAAQYRLPWRVQVATRREADSLRLYVRLPDAQPAAVTCQLLLTAWNALDARRPLWQDSLLITGARLHQNAQAGWLAVAVPMARLETVAALSLQVGAEPEATAWLELTASRRTRTFILTDTLGEPLWRRYLPAGGVMAARAATSVTAAGSFTLREIRSEFVPALPPMTRAVTTAAASSPTLAVLSTQRINADAPVAMPQAGLFLVQPAGSPAEGLLVAQPDYPELTTATALIDPLIYLTTNAERERLRRSPDPKRAVDQFWLGVAGNQPTVARQLIRTYYGRVAAANALFSAHKAGWMTDRGMLYVVLGPPETVYRTAGQEEWLYRGDGGGTYTFRAKPSTFAAEHYELVRRPEYERLWYAAVDQWRKGLTAPTGR